MWKSLNLTLMTINSSKEENNHADNPQAMWFIYIVQTRLGHWYIGISTDVARRFKQHQQGSGAKNLRGKQPLILVFSTPVGNRSEATKLEIALKKLTKKQKQTWCERHQKVNHQHPTAHQINFVDLMPN